MSTHRSGGEVEIDVPTGTGGDVLRPVFGFWDLFPCRSSPLADAVDGHTLAWIDERRLVVSDDGVGARVMAARVGRIAALIYPAAERELLELAADLFAWLSCFDDLHVEASPDPARASRTGSAASFIASFVGVVESRERPADGAPAFTTALVELMERLRDLVTPAQAERVGSRLVSLFLAMLWEGTTAGRVVGLDEYAAMRPHTVFGYLAGALIEPCAGLDLPADVHARTPVRRLLRATALLWGWTNDLYSFAYEYQELGSLPRTLPWVLQHAHGVGLDEAFVRASAMCEEEALLAHELITRLSRSATPGLSRYSEAVGHAIGGTSRLYAVSDRWRTGGTSA